MTAVFRLPDLGEGLTEAEILEWKVAVGDTVTIDQLVVEVETAKAAVDVPVPFAGTVLELFAPAGSTVAVGEPLISVSDGTASTGSSAADRYRTEEQAGSGNVLIGYGTGHGPSAGRRRRTRPASTVAVPASAGLGPSGLGPSAVAPSGVGPSAVAPSGVGPSEVAPSGVAPLAPRVISPLVRKLARDNGIDVAEVSSSGPGGVVLRRDVEEAIRLSDASATSTVTSAPADSSAADSLAAATGRGLPGADGDVRIPLRGVRKAAAEKLARSRSEIPDATTWVDVDATKLMEAKRILGSARRAQPISLLALLARICVAGLRQFPALNATVDVERAEIVQFAHVNIGFAAQTDRGLVVPVVHGSEGMSTAQLSSELARLTEQARLGRLAPEALNRGTFTLNNYGIFGVDGSTPIINYPEAALLGVGRIVDKPWVVDGQLAVRKVTQLSLTFDHRVCDGGVAGGFLRYVADCVENPEILLADL